MKVFSRFKFVFWARFFSMASLLTQFDAAFVGAPSLQPRQTPMPRVPPKYAPPVARNTGAIVKRSPLRPMNSHHLRDVTNNTELGVILESTPLANGSVRIKTTLTTLEVRGDCVVRGRIYKKGIYGAKVEHVDPFA